MTKRRPNIILAMFDQLSPQSLPCYGHPLVKAPHLDALAERGVLFENAYCNSPLCAPSRFSMMAGQRVSRIGAWDNAAEFPSSVPTFAHYLRAAGYRTCLSGKMHFVGADQLHGYEERVTTDMYPGDFGWTPEWEHPDHIHWWFHNMLSVHEAGAYRRSLEIDYDEEVATAAIRWLYDAARDADERPFMLTVSFMHPHDPYLAPLEQYGLYDHAAIDMPRVAFEPPAARDPHSRRMWELYDRGEYRITDEHVRTARHAYYAMTSHVDGLFGNLMAALDAAGLGDSTAIVATADHGDMLGERGQWYKMSFFERSVRVPFILAAPGLRARRVPENVSLVDLLPTFMDLARDGAGAGPALVEPVDGRSLLPLAGGSAGGWPDAVHGEYMAEGLTQPLFMIKRGKHKYVACAGDPPQLYDLAADPDERRNLAGDPATAAIERGFAAEAAARWDSAAIRDAVIESQRRRLFIQPVLLQGKLHPWDYQPLRDASKIYNRNYGAELYDTDRRARIPFRPVPPPDGLSR